MLRRVLLFALTNLMVLLTLSIVAHLLGVNRFLASAGLNLEMLLAFAAVFGFGGAFISLAISRWMAVHLHGVRLISPEHPRSEAERFLLEKVYALSREAGLAKMPQVGIYDSPEVNAFATGPSKNRSLVAVSSGLLKKMDEDAITGVLAHEVAHIANGDMVTMTLLQGVINTFVIFLSRVCAYIVSRFTREELTHMVYFMTAILFDLLFSILGSLVLMAYSRYREFRADAGGARLAGRERMIHALSSLRNQHDVVELDHKSVAALKINGKRNWMGLFSTHPPLEVRIERLRQGM